MFKIDPPAFFLAAIGAVAIVLSLPSILLEMGIANLVGGGWELALLGVSTAGSMAFAFMLPRLRAGFFRRAWRVPSSTYLLPRWLIQLFLGTILGQVIGLFVVAILKDYRLLWLVGSTSLVGGAFYAGAWRRLSQHANTEFEMRWWRCR